MFPEEPCNGKKQLKFLMMNENPLAKGAQKSVKEFYKANRTDTILSEKCT